jgi:hypothetical protein
MSGYPSNGESRAGAETGEVIEVQRLTGLPPRRSSRLGVVAGGHETGPLFLAALLAAPKAAVIAGVDVSAAAG